LSCADVRVAGAESRRFRLGDLFEGTTALIARRITEHAALIQGASSLASPASSPVPPSEEVGLATSSTP